MKTDRFADSIRRKLDSIRPEFDNRDWDRMQNSLRQAGMAPDAPVVRPFFGSAARMAAAGIAGTALFLTTTIWQHYELKRVRQTLEQVTQKTNVAQPPAPPATATPPSGNVAPGRAESLSQTSTPMRVDTVYITRYVPMSGPRSVDENLPSGRVPGRRGSFQSEHYVASEGDVINTQPDVTLPTTTNPDNRVTGPAVPPADAPSATPGVGRSARPVGGNTGRSTETGLPDRRNTTLPGTRSDIAGNGPAGMPNEQRGRKPATDDVAIGTDRPAQPAADGTNNLPAEANQLAGRYELAAGLPMHFDTVYWDKKLAQRARRMRPARTLPTGEKSPVGQRIEPMMAKVRVGITGEANTRMWTAGGLVEFMAGRHWVVGAGLQQSNFSTGRFLTDEDFNQKTRRDFRRNYARGIDPRHEILNISTQISRIQVPILVGYRVPITPTLAVLPTLGTNLTLYSQEHVAFYFRTPFKKYDLINDRINRPVDLFNNVTFSPALEWQQKHWGWLVGPSLTLPVKTNPYYKQNVAASLRARIFYRF